MRALHPGAEATGEHRHVDEAHDRAAVDGAPHVHMVFGREHPADAAAGAIGLEQKSSGGRGEARTRKIAPAVPAFIVRIRSRSTRDTDVLQPFGLVLLVAQAARSAIIFLVSAI